MNRNPASDHSNGRTVPIIAMVGCDPSAPGGISTVIRLLMCSPLAEHWPVEVVPTWVTGSRARQAAVYAQAVGRLWVGARRRQVQAVHLHLAARGSFWRKWFLSQVLRGSGVTVLIHIHDGTLPQWHAESPAWVRRLFRVLLERSDAAIALSPAWESRLRVLAPLAPWRVVRNPVELQAEPSHEDHSRENPQRAARPSRANPPDSHEDGRHLLFLGRLRLDKGLDDLLAAAVTLKALHPHWHWTLAGDGNLDAVRKRISTMGLDSAVTLTGWLDEQGKRRALEDADVLVLPSHAEGQPLAVLEAMAYARPVVATDVGDIPELLACGAGRVVRVGDARGLAQALHELLGDRDAARAMGRMGRRHVEQHHGVEQVASQMDRLYRELALQPRCKTVAADSPRSG